MQLIPNRRPTRVAHRLLSYDLHPVYVGCYQNLGTAWINSAHLKTRYSFEWSWETSCKFFESISPKTSVKIKCRQQYYRCRCRFCRWLCRSQSSLKESVRFFLFFHSLLSKKMKQTESTFSGGVFLKMSQILISIFFKNVMASFLMVFYFVFWSESR